MLGENPGIIPYFNSECRTFNIDVGQRLEKQSKRVPNRCYLISRLYEYIILKYYYMSFEKTHCNISSYVLYLKKTGLLHCNMYLLYVVQLSINIALFIVRHCTMHGPKLCIIIVLKLTIACHVNKDTMKITCI